MTTAANPAVLGTPPPRMEDIRTVACVGIGTIGGGWAAYFLARGYRVRAWDPAPDAAERVRALIAAAWGGRLVHSHKIAPTSP